MIATDEQQRLLALCAIPGMDWCLLAREGQRPNGLARLLRGELTETGSAADDGALRLAHARKDPAPLTLRVDREIRKAAKVDGVRLTTVLDDDYPSNLRVIYNLPPFLFYRGSLLADDTRSIAVVGTRGASQTGLDTASWVATELARAGVTVLSGLARGIDAAAHAATLDAGGRTIAIMGTGITRCYPAENANLAERIVERGALVSQFWPTAPPARYNFPRRNVVTSGMGQGTVVVEATRTSGAKMQARLALEHGKRVFLLRSLVASQTWARDYVSRGAIEVESVDDILRFLRSPEQIEALSSQRRQLALDIG